MDIISVVEMNQIYWLGRYTERVFTTIRHYFSGRDHMIEDPDYYITYCRDFTIPNCYASAEDFLSIMYTMRKIRIQSYQI